MKLLCIPARALAIGTVSVLVLFPVRAAESPLSGDLQMAEVVASYTRPMLDRGGWDNTLMRDSGYAAANPLLAAQVGSGATSGAG